MLTKKVTSFLKHQTSLIGSIRCISIQREELMIGTEELHDIIRAKEPSLRILNATWYMPNMNRDAKAEHFEERISKYTKFFDHDKVADTENPLSHSLPDLKTFENCMRELQVRSHD